MQWATLKFMSEVHLWLSFGYLFELAVSDKNYTFYAPLKFSSSPRRANIAPWKISLGYCLKGTPQCCLQTRRKNSNFNPLFGLSLTPFWNHPLWGPEFTWKFWAYPIYHSPWSLQLIDTLTLPAWGRTAVKPPLASTLPKGVSWYFFDPIGSDSQFLCFRKACLTFSLLGLHFSPHLGG